jgi:hypothetical protein
MATKVCSKCGEEKDAETCFSKKSTSNGKYHAVCKECVRSYNRDYFKKKKEHIRNKKAEYYAKNKDLINSHRREYRDKHRDLVLNQKRIYAAKNRLLINSRRRECENRPERKRIRKLRRDELLSQPEIKYKFTKKNALSRGIKFDLSFDYFCDLIKQKKCYYCGNSPEYISAIFKFIMDNEVDSYEFLLLKQRGRHAALRSARLSVDRYDSLSYYREGNCVAACCFCNQSKGWAIGGDQYKLIAPAVIANIVRICEEAGMSIPLASAELCSEDESGQRGGSMDGGLLHSGGALFETALDVPISEVCDPIGSISGLLCDSEQ